MSIIEKRENINIGFNVVFKDLVCKASVSTVIYVCIVLFIIVC